MQINKRGDFFKNPYTIVLTILVLFIFLVLITLLIRPPVQEKTPSIEEIQECEFCNDILQTNVISIQGNIEECNSLKDEYNKKRCRYNIIFNEAYTTNNIELCNQLEDAQNCKDNYYLIKAFEENNKDLCSQIKDMNTKEICSK